jgi:hypothetical protein
VTSKHHNRDALTAATKAAAIVRLKSAIAVNEANNVVLRAELEIAKDEART